MATAVTRQLFLGVTCVMRAVRSAGLAPAATGRPGAGASAAAVAVLITNEPVTVPAAMAKAVRLVIFLKGPP
ncbi:hypothetical protein GCM10009574_079660 [Streptomyces asiaticus]|uniref:Uncharacterized protein n=2 Tax=Streptomyces rhizosphaericus TaxID=114699 RepID=A0ABN1QHR3_9ACTN